MKELFNINKKEKPLVKIPDFTFIGYHNLQPGIGYYVREYSNNNNYDIMEAKIERTRHIFGKRYTLGAGTTVKVLDGFMTTFLKHRNENLSQEDFVEKVIEECNITDETVLNRFRTSEVPNDFVKTKEYKNVIKDGYKLLYVTNSDKGSKFEQSYMVFAKEIKQKIIDTDVNYFSFKPIQIIVKIDYLKGKTKDKYNVYEFPEINIPTSILK